MSNSDGSGALALDDFSTNPESVDGVQCTGVRSDGSRCPRIVEYTADRLLCEVCRR